MTKTFKNVLIIKLKHFGDTLLATPVITGIKKVWPEARVSLLVNPGHEGLIEHHPEITEVIIFPRSGGLRERFHFLMSIRRRRFDLVLELSGGDRGAFIAFVSGAPTRVGYRPDTWFPLNRRFLYTHEVGDDVDRMHTVEYHLAALRKLGADPGTPPLSLYWPPETTQEVHRKLKENGFEPGRPYAVVHPTARWMFKAWRPDANARVIDFLMLEKKLTVVVTSDRNPEELAFVSEVLATTKAAPINLAGKVGILELAALISEARIFFGVDSLPMHIAAAVETPAVALFGPSIVCKWRPWGHIHQVISKNWACQPCDKAGCNDSRISRCLREIQDTEVYPILEQCLAATTAREIDRR